MAEDPKAPIVKVTWQDHDISASVLSVEIEDHDRLIDMARIVLDDHDGLGANMCYPEERVTIELGWKGESAVLFEGVVTSGGGEAGGSGQQVTMVAYDLSYRMTRVSRPDKYEGKLSDILKKIVKERHKIEIGQVEPEDDHEFPPEKPLIQAGQNDYDLIHDLARRYQARAFVEYNGGKSKFYFMPTDRILQSDSMGSLRFCGGTTSFLDFKFQRIAARADARRTVNRLDPDTGGPVDGTPPPPATSPPPALDGHSADRLGSSRSAVADSATAAAATADPLAQTPEVTVSGGASDVEEAENGSRRDPTRILGLFGEGTTVGTVKLRAKGKVKIEGIAGWAEGDWYVKKVVHVYSKNACPSYQTKFVVTR